MAKSVQYAVVQLPGESTGVRIAFSEWGTTGRPIVFVHGLFSSRKAWESAVFPELLGAGRLIALDLPGFGESPPLTQPLTVDRCVEMIRAFLEIRGCAGSPALVGNSIGGTLALATGSRYPECVSAVVAQGAIIRGQDFSFLERAFVEALWRVVRRGGRWEKVGRAIALRPIGAYIAFRVLGIRELRRIPDVVRREGPATLLQSSFRSGIALLRDAMRFDLTDALRGFQPQVLLVDGLQVAKYPPIQTLDRLAALMPSRRRRVVWIIDAGHAAPFVQPKAFASTLRRFLVSL